MRQKSADKTTIFRVMTRGDRMKKQRVRVLHLGVVILMTLGFFIVSCKKENKNNQSGADALALPGDIVNNPPAGDHPQRGGEGTADQILTPSDDLNLVNYQQTIEPIMRASCLGGGCHEAAVAAAGIALESYDDVRINMGLSLLTIEDASMPVGRDLLADDQVAALLAWVASGFPIDAETITTIPNDGSIDYSLHIAPLIATSCLGASCHSGDNPADGINLETEESLRGFFSASLESIQSGSMPIDRPALSQEHLQTLMDYQAQNFPNGGGDDDD